MSYPPENHQPGHRPDTCRSLDGASEDGSDALRVPSPALTFEDLSGFNIMREPGLALEQFATGDISLTSLLGNLNSSQQPDPFTRIKCANALARLPNEDIPIAAGCIAKSFRAESSCDVRVAVLNTLAAFGPLAANCLPIIEKSFNSISVSERVAAFRAFQQAGGDKDTLARAAVCELGRKSGAIGLALDILAANPIDSRRVPKLLRTLFSEEFVDRELEAKKLRVLQSYLRVTPKDVMSIAPAIVEELRATGLISDTPLVLKPGYKNDRPSIAFAFSPSPIQALAMEALKSFVEAAKIHPKEFQRSFKSPSDYDGVILLLQGNYVDERKAGLQFAGILFKREPVLMDLAIEVLRNLRDKDLGVCCEAGRAVAQLGPAGVAQAIGGLSRSVPTDVNFRMATLSAIIEAKDTLKNLEPNLIRSIVNSCARIFEESEDLDLWQKTIETCAASGRQADQLAQRIGKIALGQSYPWRHEHIQRSALRALVAIGRIVDSDVIGEVLSDGRNALNTRIEAANALAEMGRRAHDEIPRLRSIADKGSEPASLRDACVNAILKIDI